MKIRYTGFADTRILHKGDAGLERDVVWEGHGNVQNVAKEVAEQLLQLPDFEDPSAPAAAPEQAQVETAEQPVETFVEKTSDKPEEQSNA